MGSWPVRRSAVRWLALCARRLRGASDEVGVAFVAAPAGIDVLHLNAALRRTANPTASSAVIRVTPRRERPPMAQLDGREPQMAQIRWQRTESPHPYVCPLCQIRTFLVSDLDRPFCHPLSMVPIRVTPMASSSRNTAVEIPAGTRSTSCRIQMAPTASSAELAGALTWHPSECDRCVALQVSVSGGWRFTGMLLV
jgi:hypothetical protein